MAGSKVTAIPNIGGRPLIEHAKTYPDYKNQPPEDEIIGECVGEAVRSAWKAGHDPASSLVPFTVTVVFD